jgi:hypothetical protein
MNRRQLIYVPEIEPNTFLLFYSRGDTGRSYSLRDYTVTLDPPRLTYAEAYQYSADEILLRATRHFDADRVSTKDVGYWREQIASLNQQFLIAGHQEQPHPVQQTQTQSNKVGNVLSILGSSGQQICSVDDWFHFAPPKMGSKHWKDGRSAKELAKAFCARGLPAVPAELLDLLASSDQLGDVQFTQAWPEHKIQLDSYWGETRNADLAAVGTGKTGVVAVTVEAKADEPFGQTIATELAGASASSKLPNRISSLSNSVLGRRPCEVGELRYQLLHGIAATLIYAKEQKAAAAVLIVFEFNGPSCSDHSLKRNTADLDAFVSALSPPATPIKVGHIVGPFSVPGDDRVPANIPLFIGKAVHFVA